MFLQKVPMISCEYEIPTVVWQFIACHAVAYSGRGMVDRGWLNEHLKEHFFMGHISIPTHVEATKYCPAGRRFETACF